MVYKPNNTINHTLEKLLSGLDNIDVDPRKDEIDISGISGISKLPQIEPADEKKSGILKRVINFYKDGWEWKVPATIIPTISIAYAAGLNGIGYNIKPIIGPGKAVELDFNTILYPFSHLNTAIQSFFKRVLYDVGPYAFAGSVRTQTPELTMNFNRLGNFVLNNTALYTIYSLINSAVKRYGER